MFNWVPPGARGNRDNPSPSPSSDNISGRSTPSQPSRTSSSTPALGLAAVRAPHPPPTSSYSPQVTTVESVGGAEDEHEEEMIEEEIIEEEINEVATGGGEEESSSRPFDEDQRLKTAEQDAKFQAMLELSAEADARAVRPGAVAVPGIAARTGSTSMPSNMLADDEEYYEEEVIDEHGNLVLNASADDHDYHDDDQYMDVEVEDRSRDRSRDPMINRVIQGQASAGGEEYDDFDQQQSVQPSQASDNISRNSWFPREERELHRNNPLPPVDNQSQPSVPWVPRAGEEPLEAELAPDDDQVAARVAERLSAEMSHRLQQEIEAQMAEQQQQQQQNQSNDRSAQPMAEVIGPNDSKYEDEPLDDADNHHDIEQPSSDMRKDSKISSMVDDDLTKEDYSRSDQNFKICGIRRRCWGFGLVILSLFVSVSAVATAYYFKDRNNNKFNSDGGTSNDKDVVADTTAPTMSPTEPSIQNPSRWNYLLEVVVDSLVEQFPRQKDYKELFFPDFNTAFTPQYAALLWMTNEDTYIDTILQAPEVANQTLKERYALAVLYFTTNGQRWKESVNFLTGTSVCHWNRNATTAITSGGTIGDGNTDNGEPESSPDYGIYCDNTEHPYAVTRVLMSDNTLQGKLPWELSVFTHLIQLDFDENFLWGSLPKEFGELRKLRALWFKQNSLTGSLPWEFVHMTDLASVDLEDNALSGSLPMIWGSGIVIPTDSVTLSRNDDEHDDDEEEAALTLSPTPPLGSLFYLGLRLNEITGTLPASWRGISSLRFLDMEANQLDGWIPSDYGALRKLESLYLERNNLWGDLPSELGSMTVLKQLFVYDNVELKGTIPTTFQQLTNLEYFWFHNTQLKGDVDPIFCDNTPSFSDNFPGLQALKADCLGINPEVTCSCCTQCCFANGQGCVEPSN